MNSQYDRVSDVVFVKLRDTKYANGEELDANREMLLDKDGRVIGIQFLYASEGVDLDGIPESDSSHVVALRGKETIKIRSAA